MTSRLPVLALLLPLVALATEAPRATPLALAPGDVLATGNEWLSLPEIRAADGALVDFNVLSMRDRGLLQVDGESGQPAVAPVITVDGQPVALQGLHWELLDYWIPRAHATLDGVEFTLTWCAPDGYRAAFLRIEATNRRDRPAPVTLGVHASFGALSRVTYVPVRLRGELRLGPSPWVDPGEAFSFVTSDTMFSWALVHPGSKGAASVPPITPSPDLKATHEATLAPGETTEALYVLAAGVEEFSAAHNARSLREMLDREGADEIIARAAAWCRARTRTTGRAELDTLMNRNLLFTRLYAWGRSIDTEQLAGVTSRSPRYYVSAAYWDRDAMLWSVPGLLDADPAFAREALGYALGTQLRNTGTHSRFIDGVVLEDGFQLDEAVAPLLATAAYLARTGDAAFVREQLPAIDALRDRLMGRHDEATGLYSSLQDSQDEYQKLPFLTYDNALSWHALGDLAALYRAAGRGADARAMQERARALREAILAHCLASDAPGAAGPIFASATDGKGHYALTDIPPGSLLKLPTLGLLPEDDPRFARTYDWLHSANYRYSFSDRPYGLPGSYRIDFTSSWTIADELLLRRGHDKAKAMLLASPWDAGIISEGINPSTGRMDMAGRAFATAAGYVGHAICASYCNDRPATAGKVNP